MALIKKVRKIKNVKEKYSINLDVFEFNPEIEISDKKIKYLTGAYYGKDKYTSYPMVALYESNNFGYILSKSPVIHEQGISTYEELFAEYGYTLIN